MSEQEPPSRLQQMKGLLVGGAVGDALGAPVEFMRRHEIVARFGPEGITQFAPAYGRLGAITDDTQMTLFTLEGVIRSKVRWSERGICYPPSVIDNAYRRWYSTQTQPFHRSKDLSGWLITVPELWSRRAPGITCLGALTGERPIGEPAKNNSKGAGGIMRVAPIGLVGINSTFDTARDVAALTHGHVTGSVAAGWFARWIEMLADGAPPRDAAMTAARECKGLAPELDEALARAFQLARKPSAVVPEPLGEGWIAEEAAAIAIWCVLTASSPFEAIRLAVNIDGDSDTTGSLVGQALGVMHGVDWIPAPLIDQLELRSVIETLALDASKVFWGSYPQRPDLDAFWDRYPGG